MKKIFLCLNFIVSLSLVSVSAHAFQAYFNLNETQYIGEASVQNLGTKNCVTYYAGQIEATPSGGESFTEVFQIEGSAKVCGWVGPYVFPPSYNVVLNDGQRIPLVLIHNE